MGTKHCGKWRNCSLCAIFPFPTALSKDLYCRQTNKKQGLFGKELYLTDLTHLFQKYLSNLSKLYKIQNEFPRIYAIEKKFQL